MLLAGAGLLIRSFLNLLQYGSGFDASNTLTGTTLLTGSRYQSGDARRNFDQALLTRLKVLPDVKAAALATALPLAHVDQGAVSFHDNPNPPIGVQKQITVISVTPDYFRAVGTPLLQGRAFDVHDTALTSRVAVVNLAFAKQFFAGDALGKQFNVAQWSKGGFRFLPTTIVGVAENVRHNGLTEAMQPEFYVPMEQIPSEEVDLILRTGGDSTALSNSMREAVTAADSEQPLFNIETMEERLSDLVAPRRLIMLLLACLAVLAVILAAVGVFGVFAYSVSQRTQELGIRLAVGASRGALLRLIVTQATRLILFGGALGIGSALLLSRLLAGTVVGITPHDTLSFALAWVLMTIVALFASIFPATRAARTDIMSVLRQE
jgi:putative ABC transport system permease protein